jgi:hypothetical protein
VVQEETVEQIASMLLENTALRHICLAKFGMTDTGACLLADHLASNRTLVSLDLRACVAACCAPGSCLTAASCRNRISPDGGAALGRLLELKPTLVSLDLRGNRIADAGAEALAISLRRNRTLTRYGVAAAADGMV